MGAWTVDDIVKVLSALVTLVSAIGAVYAAIQARGAKQQGQDNASAIHDTHTAVDGKMSELISATKDAARSQGEKDAVNIANAAIVAASAAGKDDKP